MTQLATAFAQGALIDLPGASAGNNGRYYWANDTKQLFQSDGGGWTQIAAAVPQLQVLTDQANLAWDLDLGDGDVTIEDNRVMDPPPNIRSGVYHLRVTQGGAGSFTITWDAAFQWAGGTAPTLSTTAGDYDVLTFYCDGTNLYGSALINVS